MHLPPFPYGHEQEAQGCAARSRDSGATFAGREAKARGGHPRRRLFGQHLAREAMVQGQPKTFYSVTMERSYKDRDGAWKYTKSFDQDSLGKIVSLAQQAEQTIRGLSEHEAQ